MSAVNNGNDVNGGVWIRPNELDAALLMVTYLSLGYIVSAVSNNNLYKMLEGWTGAAQYALRINK